jgi:hypothetical protein
MALVNIDDWLAARGHRGSPATTGASPGDPPASLPSDPIVRELEGEIARQGDLIRRLQAALASEIDRNARLVAHIRGVPAPGAGPAQRGPSRVIRKRRGAGPPPSPPPPRAA